jgi:hypothetical protein
MGSNSYRARKKRNRRRRHGLETQSSESQELPELQAVQAAQEVKAAPEVLWWTQYAIHMRILVPLFYQDILNKLFISTSFHSSSLQEVCASLIKIPRRYMNPHIMGLCLPTALVISLLLKDLRQYQDYLQEFVDYIQSRLFSGGIYGKFGYGYGRKFCHSCKREEYLRYICKYKGQTVREALFTSSTPEVATSAANNDLEEDVLLCKECILLARKLLR